ncbi:carbohydrate porin [Erwinia aphidicola]|uniref:carbohydrate porin n=1 Tax=Erwinia aphidicola TaxID=68334 RepID=UPI003CEE26E7
MERPSRLIKGIAIIAVATALIGPLAAAVPEHRLPNALQYQAKPTAPYLIQSQNSAGNHSGATPEDYRAPPPPQPLMRGEGFNYHLYYNYRLTPHIILRPNLQQSTKPGAVSDHSQRFVGGIGAGINF